MAETSEYAIVADQIYGCQLSQCPAFCRIDDPGYFPKFGAGGRAYPKLAIVSMNPSYPTGEQRDWVRAALPRERMHESYESELLKYHTESRGAFGDLWGLTLEHAGLSRAEVYYTETAKCITTGDAERTRVLDTCAAHYLKSELESFGPELRAVICLGNDAHERVLGLAQTGNLARLQRRSRTLKSTHPAASRYGRSPRADLIAVLKSVRRQLGT